MPKTDSKKPLDDGRGLLAAVTDRLAKAREEATCALDERSAARAVLDKAEAARNAAQAVYRQNPTTANSQALEKAETALKAPGDRFNECDEVWARAQEAVSVAERAMVQASADARLTRIDGLKRQASLEAYRAQIAPHMTTLLDAVPRLRAAARGVDEAMARHRAVRAELASMGEHVPELDVLHLFGDIVITHLRARPSRVGVVVRGIDQIRSEFATVPGATLEEKLLRALDFEKGLHPSQETPAEERAGFFEDLDVMLGSTTAHEARQRVAQARVARGDENALADQRRTREREAASRESDLGFKPGKAGVVVGIGPRR
jgi:hypothetical protein